LPCWPLRRADAAVTTRSGAVAEALFPGDGDGPARPRLPLGEGDPSRRMLPVLWRFHAVHHSIEHMDWVGSGRLHPFDAAVTQTCATVPLVAGAQAEEMALPGCRGAWPTAGS